MSIKIKQEGVHHDGNVFESVQAAADLLHELGQNGQTNILKTGTPQEISAALQTALEEREKSRSALIPKGFKANVKLATRPERKNGVRKKIK